LTAEIVIVAVIVFARAVRSIIGAASVARRQTVHAQAYAVSCFCDTSASDENRISGADGTTTGACGGRADIVADDGKVGGTRADVADAVRTAAALLRVVAEIRIRIQQRVAHIVYFHFRRLAIAWWWCGGAAT